MKAQKITHYEKERIKLEFKYSKQLSDEIRKIPGSLWSKSLNAWHLPFDKLSFKSIMYLSPDMEFNKDEFSALLKDDSADSLPPIPDKKEIPRMIPVDINRVPMLCIFPENDNRVLTVIQQLPGICYDEKWSGWLLENTSQNLSNIFQSLRGVAWIDCREVFNRPFLQYPIEKEEKIDFSAVRQLLPEIDEANLTNISRFRDWLTSSRYSSNSIKTYTDSLCIFFRYLNNKPPTAIDNNDLLEFNNRYILGNGYSASFQNQVINAVKLYFRKIENRKLDIEAIQRPRREKRLPNVLSKDEIASILKAASSNIKHKAMLSLIYSCGLRRSELLNLKLTDIDTNRGLLIIRNAKGKKDRVTPLSEKIVDLLRENFKVNRTREYVFEGWNPGSQYSERSLEEVLKKYVKLAAIRKPVTLHWLRHSYATHLLENGTDLRYIQEILGHKSSKTTEIYTHVSTKQLQKIKSPFDDLTL